MKGLIKKESKQNPLCETQEDLCWIIEHILLQKN